MNCAERILEPTIFFNMFTPSHHRIRVRKSLAQETFRCNLEYRYEIIVSSIKFRIGFAKLIIPIALFKKFLS